MDGLHRRLSNALLRNWRGTEFAADFVDDCICQSLLETANALLAGRQIKNLRAYVLKAADRKLYNAVLHQRTMRDEQQLVATRLHAPLVDQSEAEARSRSEEFAVAKALMVARELLPHVGTGRVIEVLEVFLEAVEQGIPDLPASSVADTLGLSPSEVRSLLHRGLTRMRRAAAERGITLPQALHPAQFDHYDSPVERLFLEIPEKESDE